VGDNTATRFLNGEFSNQEVADLMRLANLQTEQMNAEAVVEAWRTAGQFIPGVGAGVALAEGDGIRGSAYFVRDVVLTVTGTKLLQGGKTLAGMTLRGAGLGAMQGGTSAAFDIGAARAEAAWNGDTYAGTVNGDAWEMFRATRNGAAFGLVLGPVAKMASLRRAGSESGYVFRGTTRGYPGGGSGVTFTSRDPAVATVFAAQKRHLGTPVIEIARKGDLAHIPRLPSTSPTLAKIEAEIIFDLAPSEFSRLATQIPLNDAILALNRMNVRVPSNVPLSDVSSVLRELQKLEPNQIEQFLRILGQ
jgi:hypothetical protein